MNRDNALSYLCCTISAVLTATQTEHVFQIIQIILTCLATAVALAFSVWKWYREAMKDGKIDKKEAEQLVDIIQDNIKNINNDKENKE